MASPQTYTVPLEFHKSQSIEITHQEEPAYKAIAQRKQAYLNLEIPKEWRLSPWDIPPGMLSPMESITGAAKYNIPVNVMDIPKICGLLTMEELKITEDWDVKGLLSEIKEGRLKTEDVVRAFCKRAAIAHQLTRCLTEPLFSQALDRARHLDHYLQQTGKQVGPLHGLPITVKDTYFIKGVDSTIGLTSLAFKPAEKNAALVDLLLSLGAVIISKTTVPQTMGAFDTVNVLFGRTLNPINRQLTAGGSSGGEAVMVAMRGCMVGFGSDVAGSIRVPAMCNGIYGIKPSLGRIPYGGQQDGQLAGKGRASIQPLAGPLARSVEDLGAVMQEIVPRAQFVDEDCIPGVWSCTPCILDNGVKKWDQRRLRVGVLRTDGTVTPLPPIAKILDEVAQILGQTPGIEVFDIPTPTRLKDLDAYAWAALDVDGGNHMMDLLAQTGEPLMPWLQKLGLEAKPAISIEELFNIHVKRAELENELRGIWMLPDSQSGNFQEPRYKYDLDAIISPVAPHPVPPIDSWGTTSYTTSWVLLDCPAGVIPVRKMKESDLQLGTPLAGTIMSPMDSLNREKWDEQIIDRRMYLDTPLSIQVATPKKHDYELFQAMKIIDGAIRGSHAGTD